MGVDSTHRCTGGILNVDVIVVPVKEVVVVAVVDFEFVGHCCRCCLLSVEVRREGFGVIVDEQVYCCGWLPLCPGVWVW